MIAIKPKLIVTEERRPVGLAATTWEQRQGYRDRNGARIEGQPGVGMTAAELAKQMGASWVNHPDFKGRDYTLNPEPNLAGVQPCVSCTEYGVFAQWRNLLRWVMQ